MLTLLMTRIYDTLIRLDMNLFCHIVDFDFVYLFPSFDTILLSQNHIKMNPLKADLLPIRRERTES